MTAESNPGFDEQRSKEDRDAWCRTYAQVWADLSTGSYDKKAVEKAADEHWQRNPNSDPVQIATVAAGFSSRASTLAGAKQTPHSVSSPMPDPSSTSIAPPQPVAPSARQLVVFASGFALAAAVFIGVWMTLGPDSLPAPGKSKTNVTAPHSAALASVQLAACPQQPATVAAGEKDGKFPLQVDESHLIAADIASFIFLGRDAAVAGRLRDAELAFLMSCRVADKLKGADSVESADARYELGSHYAKVALEGSSAAGANRAELLRRAELLYSDSLHVYRLKYGEAHEKSRFATEGLAAVHQTLAQAQTVQPASAPVPKLATANEEPEKPPKLALPGAGAALTVSPLPTTDAEVKNRQHPSVTKACPEAVVTLGLCNPGD